MPFIVLVLAGYSEAVKTVSVKGLRARSYSTHTRVVVDIDGATEYKQDRLLNPDRLFFDLKNCSVPRQVVSTLAIDDGILKKVRAAQFDRNTVRIVLDVEKLESSSVFMLENPNRLVIDVYRQKGSLPTSGGDRKTAEPEPTRIRRIVIDPGHGGDDPGAVGASGLKEKDIVLAVGKRLGSLLKEQSDVEVIYTRDKDVFIPLNERTEIANANKADLFISVHANASPRRATRGIETYFLNWTNDKEALRVAARENKVSFKKMEMMQGDLQMILDDLARKNKNEESMKLASSVQSAMVTNLRDNYKGIEDLGVKYALFYVLVGAEMPAVLVEISFISNREEEKRLAQDTYKNRIAESIAAGISSYMTQTTVVAQKAGGSI